MPQTTSNAKRDPAQRRSESVRRALGDPSRRHLSRAQREHSRQRLLVLVGAALGLLIVGILVVGYVREIVLRGQETVAVVHGEPITAAEVVEVARPFYRNMNQQAEMMRQFGMAEEASQVRFQLQMLPSQAVQMKVERRLIQREAQARGIQVTDEEVRAELRQQIEAETAIPQLPPEPTAEGDPAPQPTLSDAEFDAAYRDLLRRAGLDDLRYRQLMKDELLAERVRDAVSADVDTSAEQVRSRHILVEDQEQAREVLQQLQDGASFEELASAESGDPSAAENAGDLGWLPRGVLDDAFEDTVFSTPPGSGPQVVQSAFGWHVVEVLEYSQDRPLEEELLELVKMRHFQEWLGSVQEGPDVEVHFSLEKSEWILRRLQGRLF